MERVPPVGAGGRVRWDVVAGASKVSSGLGKIIAGRHTLGVARAHTIVQTDAGRKTDVSGAADELPSTARRWPGGTPRHATTPVNFTCLTGTRTGARATSLAPVPP